LTKTEMLHELVSAHLAQIESVFSCPMKLTFIARREGDNDSDVIVTSEDDLDQVIASVERSKAREVNG
jgi:hypothetical protein